MKQETIRVTKTFTFDMAHALFNHDGPCKNIHGHTYHLAVTLIGKAIQEHGHPKNGMIIDFADLKQIVHKSVLAHFDHALVLNSIAPHPAIELLHQQYDKIILLPFQPSCENLILEIKNRIMISLIHTNVSLHSLKLHETPTSYAEWFITDNT
jgi:6-pyruvoyltetrahydropterin/6-carboxytetrahydropterin synthase